MKFINPLLIRVKTIIDEENFDDLDTLCEETPCMHRCEECVLHTLNNAIKFLPELEALAQQEDTLHLLNVRQNKEMRTNGKIND